MFARKVIVIGLAILETVILMSGCNVIKPLMPVENYRYTPQKPQTSIINLYADLEVAKLERLINGSVDSILYQDTSFTDNNGDNLKLMAWKGGRCQTSV